MDRVDRLGAGGRKVERAVLVGIDLADKGTAVEDEAFKVRQI